MYIKSENEQTQNNKKESTTDTLEAENKPRVKGETLERHRITVREILLNTNATPIRSRGGIGYSCCFCTDQYPDPADLKRHNIDAHDDEAKGSFMKGKDLSKFYVKLDVTNLHCTICNEEITNIEQLINHLKDTHNKTMYMEVKSQILPFKFDSEGLKCFVCMNSFHNFRVLVEHMNIHYRNFICKVCDAGFVSQSILFQHAKTHKIGSFKCDYCTKIFETLLKKRAHERVVHTHSNVLNKCGYCVETFKDYWQREKHLATVHGISSIYKCQACDKTFTHQKGLRIHTKRDHLMERPHACTQCEMKFFTGKKLKEHMVKHTGLREFQCKVCLKCYGRKKTLNQHMRVHEDFCRFKCEHCGQGFVQRTSWVGHMRSKHGEQV